jgi:3-oxoacyl-[acyl-carrier protein] reductase
MVNLSGKLAIVSGGARDIGRAICIQLARCGASIAFCYFRSEQSARETSEALRQIGTTALSFAADLTKRVHANAFIAKVRDEIRQPVDILVNNTGGLCGRQTIAEMDEVFWDHVINVNLKSTFLLTKAVLPYMKDGSTIINISSLAARDGGGKGSLAYAAAKGGIISFTRGLAKELGPQRIRVNAVCPGMINTAFQDTFTQPEVRHRVAAMTPLGREGNASEIGDLVAYLASEESSYINGASIDINGGLFFS